MTKRLFLIFILSIFSCTIFSQKIKELGNPFIKNYSPKIYQGAAQNWAIVQDKRGVMYFGNKGILEYDGNNWRTISVSNNSFVRSLDIDSSGTIYVGAIGEFGFLDIDETGKLHYVSLSSQLDSAKRNFSSVWCTNCIKDDVCYTE